MFSPKFHDSKLRSVLICSIRRHEKFKSSVVSSCERLYTEVTLTAAIFPSRVYFTHIRWFSEFFPIFSCCYYWRRTVHIMGRKIKFLGIETVWISLNTGIAEKIWTKCAAIEPLGPIIEQPASFPLDHTSHPTHTSINLNLQPTANCTWLLLSW